MLSVGASLVLATMYLVVVRGSTPAFAALPGAFLPGFVLLTALRTVNSLTDSAFMGLRAPHVNLWVSGVGQGLLKNAFPLLFEGAGATGIFLSYTVAGAVAAVVSALLLVGRYRVPVLLRVHRQTLQEVWSFSTSSYVAYLLHMLPIIVLPLVIIEARGSAEAGYYYLAFTCANLIYIAVYAVSQTLITEHSYEAGDLRGRAARLNVLVVVPGSVALAAGAPLVLGVFGQQYREAATSALVVLALTGPVVAVYDLATAVLRTQRRGLAFVVVNLVYCAVVLSAAAVMLQRLGLVGVALAWPLGSLVAGVLAWSAIALGQVPVDERNGLTT